ncbi:MAG: hypothetical protein A2Y73_05410 [Chloroflexi bacterium RBG_13_56_8]|nr:MAG: hypothetical protein A2Y73_05410 [Chloroflexi bacterium RBG_13_56_8]
MHTRRDVLPFPYQQRTVRYLGLGRIDPRTLVFFAIALGVIGLAGWLYLQQASLAASYAHQIGELVRQQERLQQEILVLRADVAYLGSIGRTEAIANQLGYSLPDASDPSRYLSVVVEPTLASAAASVRGGEDEISSVALSEGVGLRPKGFVGRLIDQVREWTELPVDEGEFE